MHISNGGDTRSFSGAYLSSACPRGHVALRCCRVPCAHALNQLRTEACKGFGFLFKRMCSTKVSSRTLRNEHTLKNWHLKSCLQEKWLSFRCCFHVTTCMTTQKALTLALAFVHALISRLREAVPIRCCKSTDENSRLPNCCYGELRTRSSRDVSLT